MNDQQETEDITELDKKYGEEKPSAEFAKLLEEAGPEADRQQDVAVGKKVKGKIQKIDDSSAFVDFGGRSEAVIDLQELRADNGDLNVSEGDTIEAVVSSVEGEIRLTSDGTPWRPLVHVKDICQAIRLSLHQQIANAQRRIWFCTPYFVPTLSLRRRLARAARRGVDVRLLLPGESHDHPGIRYAGQRFYRRLLRAGVRIYEYQPRFIHAKFSLADDWATIGSCNFDHWSLQWNPEANQEIHDARFAKEVAVLFEKNFTQSREILPEQWARRPLGQRLREWLFGTLDAWVTRLK